MKGMTPELKAVFNVIEDAWKNSKGDVFYLKFSEIFMALKESGKATKYGITVAELRRLLNELASLGIKLDYVEEVLLDSRTNKVDYRWRYGGDWIHKEVQTNRSILEFWDKAFFNLNANDIKNINEPAKKVAILRFDDPHLVVSYNNSEYKLAGLTSGKPYTIIEFIMKNKLTGKRVTKEELSNKCNGLGPLGKKDSFKSIFKENPQVRILKPFITIEKEFIMIVTRKALTEDELTTIINSCNT